MKTVCSLLVSLFIVIGIASCDSATSPDTREGQRIGTFIVYDSEMQWIGTQSQSKAKGFITQAEGDTTFFDYPDGKNLFMVDEEEHFAIYYQDSLYNQGDDVIPKIHVTNTLYPNFTEWPSYGIRSDHIEYSLGVKIKCDSSYSDIEDFVVNYYAEADTTSEYLKTAILNTQGITSAAKSLRCN